MALTLKVPFLLFYIVYVLYILDFLVVFILYISVRCPIRATQIHRYLFSVTFIADSQLVCADLLGLEAYSWQEDFTQRCKNTGNKTGTGESIILSCETYA